LNENFLTNELLEGEPEESRDFVTITVNGVSTPINRTTVKLAHLEQVLEEHERSVALQTSMIGRKRARSPSEHYSPERTAETLDHEFEIEELLSDDEDSQQFEVEELDDSDSEPQHQHTEKLADNMTLVDGQMIVWTKDEDRWILSAVRDSGPKPETWTALSHSQLPQRTSKQIAERYAQLMELLRQRIGSQAK